MTLRLSRTFLGTMSLERECGGFHVGLRRATVPAEAVPEHAHETAHLILAIDDDYVSSARGASSWRGPSMLVYNPPGTVHRDRYGADNGGRFVSIDLPAGVEPAGVQEATVVQSSPAKAIAASIVAGVLAGASSLAIEDRLLMLTGALSRPRPAAHAPSWLTRAAEAIGDLANNAELRVRDIADIVGVHPVHLARVFRHYFSCSPGAAIRRVRVERVAAALSHRGPMTDLSYDHGFADQAHMIRCFRGLYGTTPSAFRAAFD